MGNDLKLPTSEQMQEVRDASESERKQLVREIDRIHSEITSIENQTDMTLSSLKRVNNNSRYYEAIIKDMNNSLLSIEVECINANLTKENFIEKAKCDLNHLLVLSDRPRFEIDGCAEEYSETEILDLENRAKLLKKGIERNEDLTLQYYQAITAVSSIEVQHS